MSREKRVWHCGKDHHYKLNGEGADDRDQTRFAEKVRDQRRASYQANKKAEIDDDDETEYLAQLDIVDPGRLNHGQPGPSFGKQKHESDEHVGHRKQAVIAGAQDANDN